MNLELEWVDLHGDSQELGILSSVSHLSQNRWKLESESERQCLMKYRGMS